MNDLDVGIAAGKASATLISGAKLISSPGFPHGMPTTQPDRINADILAFIRR